MSETTQDNVAGEKSGPASAIRQELAQPAIMVATSSEAAAVDAALDELSITADVRIGDAGSLGDDPTLVVGTLVDELDSEDLSMPSRDFLLQPFTPEELALRLRTLAERSHRLCQQQAATNDLEIIVRSIADAVRVAVLFFDADDRPRLRNKMVDEVLALTGYDPETGTSTHVYSPDRATRVKRGKDIVSETLKGNDRGIIYWVGDPDHDEQRAIITESHHVTRPDGTSLGSAVLSYDITDLANAIEAREDYLTNISHELRTPLTAVVGYLDLITETYDTEKLGFHRELGIIQRNLDQLTSLVNELAFADGREQNLRIEPTDLKALISQSVSALQPAARKAELHIDLELPDSPLIGLVDAIRVRQVLDNLVSNAVKYTPPEGRIDVSLLRDGDDAIACITNTGIGLTKSDQARIFDRFFRSQEARATAARGVGIGLAIAKTLVDAHGGSIEVDSVPDEYTTFTVTLPLRREGAPLSSFPEDP